MDINFVANILIGIFAISAGCFCLYLGLKFYRSMKVSLTWQTTKGKIQKIDIVRHDMGDQADLLQPVLYYLYEVDGKSYQSNVLRIPENWSTNDPAILKRVLAPYSQGATVDVFYNPENPEQAILERGVRVLDILIWIFLGLMMLIPGFLCIATTLAN